MRSACLILFTLVLSACGSSAPESNPATDPAATPSVATPRKTVRLVGTIEAVRAFSILAPRLRGGNQNAPMVITRLAPSGSRVGAGDVVVELDSQEQERVARDRRATFLDLEAQIRRMRADQEAARARDDTELTEAKSDVERARLAVTTNRLIPRLDAEKNDLGLEQAQARLKQLQQTYDLKRRAAAADLRIIEIRRDRAETEAQYAEENASRMIMTAPFAGLVVPKTANRPGQMVEIQEGDEARPGMPIADVVDPSAMRVRLQINQGDIGLVAVGQRARIYLDAYPGLSFDGAVEQISPLAVASGLAPAVRNFMGIVSISGTHEKLMPDLTAAVDIQIDAKSHGDSSDR